MGHNHTITREEQIFKVTTIAPIVLKERKEPCWRDGSGVKSAHCSCRELSSVPSNASNSCSTEFSTLLRPLWVPMLTHAQPIHRHTHNVKKDIECYGHKKPNNVRLCLCY